MIEPDRLGGIFQGGCDAFLSEMGIIYQDLVNGLTTGKFGQDKLDRDPCPTNHWFPQHDIRMRDDPCFLHAEFPLGDQLNALNNLRIGMSIILFRSA